MSRTPNLPILPHTLNNWLESEVPETVSKPGNQRDYPYGLYIKKPDTPIMLCLRVDKNEF